MNLHNCSFLFLHFFHFQSCISVKTAVLAEIPCEWLNVNNSWMPTFLLLWDYAYVSHELFRLEFCGCAISFENLHGEGRFGGERQRSELNTMATSATTAGGTGSGGGAAGLVGGGTAVARKKDGGPSTKFWESSETISQLETVRLWIGKHYKKVS